MHCKIARGGHINLGDGFPWDSGSSHRAGLVVPQLPPPPSAGASRLLYNLDRGGLRSLRLITRCGPTLLRSPVLHDPSVCSLFQLRRIRMPGLDETRDIIDDVARVNVTLVSFALVPGFRILHLCPSPHVVCMCASRQLFSSPKLTPHRQK